MLASVQLFAQHNDEIAPKESDEAAGKESSCTERPTNCAPFYITTSTGFNNNTGIIGVNFDVPVSAHVMIGGGMGASTWGSKLFAGAKYFLRPSCGLGWAFGAGITHSSGARNFHTDMETILGTTEQVRLNLSPQTNAMMAVYRYWHLGCGSNRFYAEAGWSTPFSDKGRYRQTGGIPISKDASDVVNALSPGGPILAIGFSFGLH